MVNNKKIIFSKRGILYIILLFGFLCCNNRSLFKKNEIANPLEYIEVSTHNEIGERYVNTLDSIILDLSFPVLVGSIPDSIKSVVPFYKLELNAINQENQFYWSWPEKWFLASHIYNETNIENLSVNILEEYNNKYQKISFEKSDYKEINNPNIYLVGHINEKKYSFWEFFYQLKNDRVFRISVMGLYPKIPQSYAEKNGKSQIKNLLSPNMQSFLFNPEMTLLNNYIGNNFDPIETLKIFEDVKNNFKLEENTETNQMLAFLYSCVNEFESYKKYMHYFYKTDEPDYKEKYLIELANLEKVTYIDAKKNILSTLKNKSILFINENHYHPRGRVFLSELLPELKKIGFRLFAAEGLSNNSTNSYKEINEIKKDIGFYTNEPEFGSLLRKAKFNGYKIFAYSPKPINLAKVKSTNDKEELRDSLMFENIKQIYENRVSKDDKIIIFCGHGHVLKQNKQRKVLGVFMESWKPAETLFVYQSLIPELYYKQENSLTNLNANQHPQIPTINEKEFLGVFEGLVDKLILFPKTKMINGIPNWSIGNGDHKYDLKYTGREGLLYYAVLYLKTELEVFGEKNSIPYKVIPFEGVLNQRIMSEYQNIVLIIKERSGKIIANITL